MPRRGGRAAKLAEARPAAPASPHAELRPTGEGRVLVVACGALAREILAIRAQAGLDHLDLHCLPAILHNHPERIAPAVDAALAAAVGYEAAFVAYADCGTGGALAEVCARRGVEMIRGPHCYAFFEGQDAFAAHGEIDAFYLTDFLARQFDAFVTRPLGLDRNPELRELYFGNYSKLVHLAQTEDEAVAQRARAAAAALGLRFERRWTGYGELSPILDNL